MSELEPKEIKKRLQYFSETKCKFCHMNECKDKETICNVCIIKCIDYALNFINQYEAEIKALKMDNEQLQSEIINATMHIDHAQAEIDRLEKHNTKMARKHYQDGKTEAIKDIVKRLKATPLRFRVDHVTEVNKPAVSKMVLFIDDNDIDNLVEEMEAKEE